MDWLVFIHLIILNDENRYKIDQIKLL